MPTVPALFRVAAWLLAASAGLAASSPVLAAPDARAAAAIFAEASAICARDAGPLWGQPLCGPMLLVDPADRSVIANHADDGGALTASDGVFTGTLPDDVILANTPTEWSGTRWTMLIWPLPADTAQRHVLLAHELFHRIQPSLGLSRPEAGNQHLDTLQGRYLLQLEWRALDRALSATTAKARRAAIADALGFRQARYRSFDRAAADEAALETNEGVPEYTGVKLGLATPEARIAYARHDLVAFVQAPTFVRSFAYATGPAYGLLLDQADPAWRGRLAPGQRLDRLLSAALKLPAPDPSTLKTREAAYDDGTLRASEERREQARLADIAALQAQLVDGPVLVLPLLHGNYQFNPQTLKPLGSHGTVYPTMRLSDDWGVLEVEHGGALVDDASKTAHVSAAGIAVDGLSGDGWRLTLKPGWTIAAGERAGDRVVKAPAERSP